MMLVSRHSRKQMKNTGVQSAIVVPTAQFPAYIPGTANTASAATMMEIATRENTDTEKENGKFIDLLPPFSLLPTRRRDGIN